MGCRPEMRTKWMFINKLNQMEEKNMKYLGNNLRQHFGCFGTLFLKDLNFILEGFELYSSSILIPQ